jgi:voltage-gated potassium channel Kch
VLDNRGQYATFITILLAGIVLSTASILVLEFESRSPDGNITTGGAALWWGIVTITTVGYGDYYPVTFMGRITATFVMVAGIGIIGALASILASMLVAPSTPAGPAPKGVSAGSLPAAPPPAGVTATDAPSAAAPGADLVPASVIVEELANLRAEIAALRASLPTDLR